MAQDEIAGAARDILGHAQDAVGGIMGNGRVEIEGKVNQLAGQMQSAYGRLKSEAPALADSALDVAGSRYSDLESFGRRNPLATLGAGVAIGLVAALAVSGRRR